MRIPSQMVECEYRDHVNLNVEPKILIQNVFVHPYRKLRVILLQGESHILLNQRLASTSIALADR